MKRNISFKNLRGINLSYLSDSDIDIQFKKFGPNAIVEKQRHPIFDILVDTFKDPMIWLLILIGFIFYFLGEYNESISLFFAIIPLIFMDAYLHKRTQVSIESLKGQLTTNIKVIRSGEIDIINTLNIVPGDIVLLESGSYLPADGIFEETENLQIDESTLTGESQPVQKKPFLGPISNLINSDSVMVSTEHLGFAGTRSLRGSGKLRILETGIKTMYGEILLSVQSIKHEKTPLQIEVTKIVKILSIGSAFLCIFLAMVRIFQGKGFVDAFLSAATLAVAAIPEEFPVVLTFYLGVGVFRLAKKNALVRRAVSVENIGRVSCICSDKTGTITLGQLKLKKIIPDNNFIEKEVLEASLWASDPSGNDPMDQAIVEYGAYKDVTEGSRELIFPFEEKRKRESSIVKINGQFICFSKGSPETILNISNLTNSEQVQWINRIDDIASQGNKIIACAKKNITQEFLGNKNEPNEGFRFLGLLVFEDPPRKEVKDAVTYCKENSIKVMMLTGDHIETSKFVAKTVGIGSPDPNVISAEKNPEYFEEEWLNNNPHFLKKYDVISRCTPLQKFNIVKSLKNEFQVVAVTGDGVNDVPALKVASVGISMGMRGTQSAKEASSIILADDNFSTIVHAIKEGRQLFLNLSNSFEYLFLIHIPFVLTAALIPLIGGPILYLPIHVIWFELMIHPTALFSFQQEISSKNNMSSDKRNFFPKEKLVTTIVVGLLVALYILVSFKRSMIHLDNVKHARSMIIAITVFWNVVIVFALTGFQTWSSRLISIVTIITTFLLIQVDMLSDYFRLIKLSPSDWFFVLFVSLSFLAVLKSTRKYSDKKFDISK